MQIGFYEALTLILVFCKLQGAIAWSWWWIASPLMFDFTMNCIAVTLKRKNEQADKKIMEK